MINVNFMDLMDTRMALGAEQHQYKTGDWLEEDYEDAWAKRVGKIIRHLGACDPAKGLPIETVEEHLAAIACNAMMLCDVITRMRGGAK